MVRCPERPRGGRGKKLKGAGRWWAAGGKTHAGVGRVEDTRKADAEALGFTPQGLEEDQQEAAQPYEVWEEHWEALQAFLRCQTQWRVIVRMDGAQYQGIDYPALYGHPRFARLDVDEQERLMDQIQYLEAGALEVLNT